MKGEQVRIELEAGAIPGHNWVLVETNQADPSARDKAVVQARSKSSHSIRSNQSTADHSLESRPAP